MVYFQDLRYCLFFMRLCWGVGWGAVLLRCRNPPKISSLKGGGGGGGVQQAKHLVCKVGLPQIVLELL